ncbi:hypothetical protein ABIE61_001563 [Marinobacterium sp. MBR-111]|jgi:hypothetical protein
MINAAAQYQTLVLNNLTVETRPMARSNKRIIQIQELLNAVSNLY